MAMPALGALFECERFERIALIINDQAAPIVAAIFRGASCLACPPVYHSWLRTTYHAARLSLWVSLLGCTEVLDLRHDRISDAVSATISTFVFTRKSKSNVRDRAKEEYSSDSEIQYAHEYYEQLVARTLDRRPRDIIKILETSQHLMARVVERRKSPSLHGICLCPGASTNSKSWPLSRWISLSDKLHEAGYSVSMLADPSEDLHCLRTAARSSGIRILLDSSLLGAARNLAYADIAITCDSALAHLAFAVGTPILTLFGPTEPSKWFPYHLVDGGTTISLSDHPNCYPCQRMTCTSSTPCMNRIAVEDVATTICDYIAEHEMERHA
ncbi:MAG: glycosyltransferase family 9 protein [Deltaproteobacteria bacterium]|nr:glycosyltransferase family 9 protein [Deltaproteobacteria bacterium]